MPGDGFHPFGGKVSKRFRDSVRSCPFLFVNAVVGQALYHCLERSSGIMGFFRWIILTRWDLEQLAPDDAYLSCEFSCSRFIICEWIAANWK